MAIDQKKVDEATTLGLIQAFATAAEDQNSAHGAGVGIQSSLAGAWRGAASQRFNDGLTEWLDGLQQINQALQEIDGSMKSFAKLTASTEDDNLAQAAAGALGQGASWT
jgi:WXG100 family type VII secretion target